MNCLFRAGNSFFRSTSHLKFSPLSANFSNNLNSSDFYRFYAIEERLQNLRNIGISAHIDSGKTTLTERILYYTGRIDAIHEVKGKDEVGATMDYMELEREKGITIQSAATRCKWKTTDVNIIDTPGHVDFTIEVERALRVLDGAILVLCGVGGVQSQTLTVDRQMRRYNVPRLAFINKLDRGGADPYSVIDQIRTKLGLTAAAVQIPIGLEIDHRGLVDLVEMKAMYFDGSMGIDVKYDEIPDYLIDEANEKRQELLATLANVDDEIGEMVVMEEDPTPEQLKNSIKKTTLSHKFIPIYMGSAYKNKGVQPLLDAVTAYLPNPSEVENQAIDAETKEEKLVTLESNSSKPFVGLAFKLEDGKFGQLTYVRVYQGTLKRGQVVKNPVTGKNVKVSRLIRMHSDNMEEITEAGSGEICALFGIDCPSGTTFTDPKLTVSMTSMHVPDPVLSLALKFEKGKANDHNFGKALQKFMKEDPTFRFEIDDETHEAIISGMGELHLDIYVERMKREYGINVSTGKPKVSYRETITAGKEFDQLFKKQSGGSGQYAKIIGYIEPIDYKEEKNIEFINKTTHNSIPPEYIDACRKGFIEQLGRGAVTGNPIIGCRMVVTDGASHAVDSSEKAFKTCSAIATRLNVLEAKPVVLEPVMKVETVCPQEYQTTVIGALNRRRGRIENTSGSGHFVTIDSEVSLNQMFGFSNELRSLTQGKGEFSMEYFEHKPVMKAEQTKLADAYKKDKGSKDED